jgi:hypothetical protein
MAPRLTRYSSTMLLVGTASLAAWSVFAYRATSTRQLIGMALGVLLLCLTIGAIPYATVQWRSQRSQGLVPLAIGLMSLVLSLPATALASGLRQTVLEADRPYYQRVVDVYQSGRLDSRVPFPTDSLPAPIQGCCSLIRAWRDSTGLLGVEFFTDGGFPVRHSGLVFFEDSAAAKGSSLSQRWRKGRHLEGHWYWVDN